MTGVRITTVAVEKLEVLNATNVRVCVCIFAFFIRHAIRIFPGPWYSFICSPFEIPYFYTLSRIRYIFGKKFVKIKTVFWFSLQFWSEIFLILRRIQHETVINKHMSSCKEGYLLFLSHISETKIFLGRFFRKILNIKFHEIHTVPAELFHADRSDVQKWRG